MSEPSDTLEESLPEKEEPPFLRNEKIRLVIICWSLFAIALAFLLFLSTNLVFPLFLTIVLTFLGYKHLNTSLRKSERTRSMHPE